MHTEKQGWIKTPSGPYRLNIWTRLVCDRLCVCVCDGFSRCCSVSCSMTSNKRCSGAAQGHAAPLMLTSHALYFFRYSHCSCACSRPRLSVKTHVGLFPVQKQNCPHSKQVAPRGSQLEADWWTGGHTYLLAAFFRKTHTHTHTQGNERSEGSFMTKPSMWLAVWSPCCLWESISTITSSIKPSAGCKQPADGSPTWPQVTVSDRSYILPTSQGCNSRRSKVSHSLFANHQSCALFTCCRLTWIKSQSGSVVLKSAEWLNQINWLEISEGLRYHTEPSGSCR